MTLQPGVPCEWHRHKEIGVYLVCEGAKFVNTFAHQPEKEDGFDDGFAWSMDTTENPLVHKVNSSACISTTPLAQCA
jgi:hypothetical protein